MAVSDRGASDQEGMVVFLTRRYFPDGTNGTLRCGGRVVCSTIELPWRNNRRGISCIPEGRYVLRKRRSRKFGWHLEVVGVTGRSLILVHPANNALLELNGCIAPVSKISGAGLGLLSRKAFLGLKGLVFPVLEREEEVVLIVES